MDLTRDQVLSSIEKIRKEENCFSTDGWKDFYIGTYHIKTFFYGSIINEFKDNVIYDLYKNILKKQTEIKLEEKIIVARENISVEEAEGRAVNGDDTHWHVNCPKCEKEFEYIGFFDSADKTKCKCGCVFVTKKVWINDKTYIE